METRIATYEVHTDGRDERLCESVVRKTEEEGGLSDSRITDEEELEEVVTGKTSNAHGIRPCGLVRAVDFGGSCYSSIMSSNGSGLRTIQGWRRPDEQQASCSPDSRTLQGFLRCINKNNTRVSL